MPHEDRHIYFNYDEAYKAIYTLSVEKGLTKTPLGILTLAEPNRENQMEIILTLENGRSGGVDSIKYTKDFVIAALMSACRTAGIPLPKGSNKTLELAQDKIVLRVQLLR